MALTLKKAKELCIELWNWLAKTGGHKEDWPGWKKYGGAYLLCWFCEYVQQRNSKNKVDRGCNICPLKRHYGKGGCYASAYNEWSNAITTDERKICAKFFSKQIKAL